MGKKKNGTENGTENGRDQFTLDQKRKFGPVRKRSCTDVLCLLLFIAFLGVWGYMIVFFYKYVDIERTLNPSDIYGNVCGKGKFKDKPYLAFFNLFTCAVKIESSIINGCETPQVCVSRCPNVTFSINQFSSPGVRQQEAQNAICLYDVEPDAQNIWQLTQEGKCAKFYFNSDPVGGRCLPSVLKMVQGTSEIMNDLTNLPLQGINGTISAKEVIHNNEVMATLMKAIALGTKIASDIAKTWQWILIGLVMAMILAFFWIFLMQWLARYMIWLSIVAIIVVNGLGLYYTFSEYQRLSSRPTGNSTLEQMNASPEVKSSFMASFGAQMSEMPLETEKSLKYIRADTDGLTLDLDLSGKLKDELNTYRNNPTTWMVLSIVLAVILVIITSLLFCLCRRISLAIAVIEEASKAVNCMKSTLFFPIVPYILKIAVLLLWLGAVVIIASGSHPQYRFPNDTLCVPEKLSPEHQKHIFGKSEVIPSAHPNDTECAFTRPFSTNLVYGAHALNLFGVIWVLFFLMGVCYITLSGAFASYYWTFHKDEVPFFALLGSFSLCVRYHLGSVAFGSLLVAIVRFIRVILEYIDSKCKKYADNVVVKAIVCCLKCCFWCLENFIKFINKNAFIMIAIYGKNFCASAKDAFALLLNNSIRAVVLNCLSDFLMLLSKLAVTGLVSVAGFFVLTNRADFLVHFDELNYYWAPLTLFVILSYIVTSTFFNVYDVAIETIFMCYLEDCNQNDGSRERPYYMAKNLRNTLDQPAKRSSPFASSTHLFSSSRSLSKSITMSSIYPIPTEMA